MMVLFIEYGTQNKDAITIKYLYVVELACSECNSHVKRWTMIPTPHVYIPQV
jgi:hypothetical protein